MSSSTVRLFLIRHGEVDANREYRYLGRTDPRLNNRGMKQAKELGVLFAQIGIDAVLTSPMRRAVTTATAIEESTGAPLIADGRLAEIDFGEWEGLTPDEVRGLGDEHARRLAAWQADPSGTPPGGESLSDAGDRILGLVEEIAADPTRRSVALVSHVGPIKALICSGLGLPVAGCRNLFLDPATVSVLDWSEIPVLRLFNAHGRRGWETARWL